MGSMFPLNVADDSIAVIGAFKTVIYRSLKIFNYIKYDDEASLAVKTSGCVPTGN